MTEKNEPVFVFPAGILRYPEENDFEFIISVEN